MIRIDFSTAIAFYLTASLLGTFLLWVLFDERRKSAVRRADTAARAVYQCPICAHTHTEDVSEEKEVVCPQCGSYYEKKGVAGARAEEQIKKGRRGGA